jgi:hypothetical protein
MNRNRINHDGMPQNARFAAAITWILAATLILLIICAAIA